MRYYELDKEEQAILDAYELGEFKRVENFAKRKKLLQQYARNTLNKTRNINIRLSERDLQKLKAKAVREGIPYQTLAASLIHRASAE